MKRTKLSTQQLEQIKSRYASMPSKDLAQELGVNVYTLNNRAYAMGLRKSAAYLNSPACGRLQVGHNKGLITRYKKGDASKNKGMKQSDYMSAEAIAKCKKTEFKKGRVSLNKRPIGAERISTDGYVYLKIREGLNGFVLKHSHLWVQEHGPLPSGHCLWFRDRNKQNCSLDNLELITRAQNVTRNQIHHYPEELQQSIKLTNKLTRKIKEYGKK